MIKPERVSDYLERNSVSDPSGCRLWAGTVWGPLKYGRAQWERRSLMAHRLAWMAKHGPIPPGMCICHHCDVPRCINVDHLFMGTHTDNMRDRAAKGRCGVPVGEATWHAKITAETVRLLRASTEAHRAAARRYGLSDRTVRRIRSREIWKHVT